MALPSMLDLTLQVAKLESRVSRLESTEVIREDLPKEVKNYVQYVVRDALRRDTKKRGKLITKYGAMADTQTVNYRIQLGKAVMEWCADAD